MIDPPDADAANMFTASERLVQEHVRKYKTGAAELKDLIQKVLHHPDFNPKDVDHDMHDRLMRAIEDGDIEVLDLKEDGDCHRFRGKNPQVQVNLYHMLYTIVYSMLYNTYHACRIV